MKLFITGGSGFLGSVCIEKLIQSPEIERIYVLAHKTPIKIQDPKIQIVNGDVRRLNEVNIEDKIDACVLLAGAINGRAINGKATYDINRNGTASAINFCRNNNINRIILTSSINVRLAKRGAYSASKLDSEELVKSSGLDWLIFRPSLIYGRHCRFGLYVIERCIRKYGIVPVFGNGKKTEQPIHVDECAEYMNYYIINGTNGRTIELLGRDAMTYNDMCKTMAECMRMRVQLMHVPAAPFVILLKMIEALNIPIPLSSEQIYHVDTDLGGDMSALHQDTGITQKSFAENYSRDGMCDEIS